MKRIVTVLSIVATSVFLTASAVVSAEPVLDKGGKDVCLLVAMNCANDVDSYQQRIDRLNKEIAKGTDVYTNDELRKLKIELEDTLKRMGELTTGS